MPWKKNKRLISEGYPDLEYLPKERSGWDATLACLAYGIRMEVERGRGDLAAWAARHGVAASGRYARFGEGALVLWHGTSRERAEKIVEHGLFHRKGVWTATNPAIPHSFCRGRSERFATEGAVVCLVLDRTQLVEGLDFDAEGDGNVVRFHHGLPPDVVEYVLTSDGIRFVGERRARASAPWPGARFKMRSGRWVPAQKAPVRYSDAASYSTPREFAGLCVDRLLAELGEVAALEVFSTVYALVTPREVLTHRDILEILQGECVPSRRRGRWRTFRARTSPRVASRS
ncbi:MAG: hypothetical protein ACYTFI_11520 [Planctomycetota bacterium]|jgi:hypothetical protein